MVTVPKAFATAIIARTGEGGRQWIESLPQRVNEMCDLWHLEIASPAMHGEWAVVFEVHNANTPAVLKLTWPGVEGMLTREVETLSLWAGRGAVRLLQADIERQALLLERLDATTTLEDVRVGEALSIAGHLLRRLALPAPADLPSLKAVAHQIAATLPERWEQQGHPMPRRVIDKAGDLIHALIPSTGNHIVNWDLQYANVLRAEREPWLVIDPQVLAGDVEYGIAQLLWWRLEDIEAQGGVSRALDTLVTSAELDSERAHAWAYVRTVDYWLSGLDAGLTIDPPRCQRVVEALDLLV